MLRVSTPKGHNKGLINTKECSQICLAMILRGRNMYHFTRANKVFIIDDSCIDYKCLYYLLYETQRHVFSKDKRSGFFIFSGTIACQAGKD